MTIDAKDVLCEQIANAVTSHGLWKARLEEAIETGHSEWTPAHVAPCNNCDFGKWLEELPDSQKTEYYRFMFDTHAKFHAEASAILRLALDGDKDAARKRIASGSEYANLTTQLIMGAGMWMTNAD